MKGKINPILIAAIATLALALAATVVTVFAPSLVVKLSVSLAQTLLAMASGALFLISANNR